MPASDGDAQVQLVWYGQMKERERIPEDVAATVLFESDRTCCVCRERRPAQLHHIDEDPANNEVPLRLAPDAP